MKIVAGVLTFNAVHHDRFELLKDCVRSLAAEADEVIVWDNGSTDGTEDWVASIGGHLYDSPDGVTTCGRGMNMLGSACAARGDVVVLTSDDMFWRPGWREIVERFWASADPRVALFGGLLEPEYPWSVPEGGIRVDGVHALIRPSIPGSGWTFRSTDWVDIIGPVPEAAGYDDVPTCKRLIMAKRLLCAADLAEHLGEDRSTWGNQSGRYAQPLDTHGFPVTSTAPGGFNPQIVTGQSPNVGKWDHHYNVDTPGHYGDETTYAKAAEWLKGLPVEDWGCGFATFGTYHDGPYVGVDGSGKWCDVTDDLTTRRSSTPGLLLRHVLDHNDEWAKVLDNAVASFEDRMVVVLFTPLQDQTHTLSVHQFGVPNIGFKLADITDRLVGCEYSIDHYETASEFGVETVIKVWRTMETPPLVDDDATDEVSL